MFGPIGRALSCPDMNPRFETPEADLGDEKFNWCPVTPIMIHVHLLGDRLRDFDSESGCIYAVGGKSPIEWQYAAIRRNRYPSSAAAHRFAVSAVG